MYECCIYIYMYVCMYVCMYVRMYVCYVNGREGGGGDMGG